MHINEFSSSIGRAACVTPKMIPANAKTETPDSLSRIKNEKVSIPKQYMIKTNSSISIISTDKSALILYFTVLLLKRLYLSIQYYNYTEIKLKIIPIGKIGE